VGISLSVNGQGQRVRTKFAVITQLKISALDNVAGEETSVLMAKRPVKTCQQKKAVLILLNVDGRTMLAQTSHNAKNIM
jgi:hypothetical protein